MSKESILAKNTAIVTIGKICTQLISFFLLPLYTAYLTTGEYGVVDLLNTLISLLIPILTFQIDQGIFRYLIDKRDSKQEQAKLITTTIFFLGAQSIIYIILFAIISPWINNEYKYFLATNLVATAFTNVMLQIARGLGDNTKYTLGSFISATVTILLNLVFIVGFKMNAYGMLLASFLGNIACIIYTVISLKIPKFIKRSLYDKTTLKTILKYSLPLIPNAISWWIVNVSDRLIITYFMNVSMNGIYSVANKFSSVVTTIYGVFNIAWTESAAVNFKEEDRDKYFSKVLDVTIRFFGALGIGIIAYMPFAFGILVNENYSEAYLQIPILIIATMFNILVSYFGSIYVAKKLTKEIAKTSFFAAIINALINILLIKYIGLFAASISTLVAWVAMFVYRYVDSKKYIKLKVSLKMVLIMIIICTITVITYYIKNMFLCGIVAIFISIYAFYINKDTMKALTQMMKNKLIKK